MRWWIILLVLVSSSIIVSAASDIAVFQGQYYIGTEFQQGTFEFVFDIYDNKTGGNLVHSVTKNLTTGTWGQWKAEVAGVSAASNDTTKDYFVEISIDGDPQLPRNRLTYFNYLRKDVDEVTSGDISSSGRIGAEEYTYVPSEGNSISDSFFNFVSPLGGDLIRISPKEDFLGFPNTTSIFIISDNESYVGMTYFVSPISGLPNSWLWADIHNGNGGFALINTENLSVGKEYIVKGAFSDRGLSLGGVSNNPQGENSAGSDFKIYSDANGTTAFFVDSANSYATTIDALLNVTDTAYFYDAYVNGTKICLKDGTNCLNLNISGNEAAFTGWDKNESDDFSGSWDNLTDVPLGFSDKVDNDTIYISGNANISIIGTVITFVGDLFSGSWNDLTDVPAGFSDNVDDDTQYTHLSNFIDDIGATADTDTHVAGDGIYLTNDSTTMYFDETKLNATIDAREIDTDTNCFVDGSCPNIIYESEEGNLNVNSSSWWAGITGWIPGWFVRNGNSLDFNETKLNATIDTRASLADTDTHVAGDGIYLTNDSTTMYFDETKLNATIDAREIDTDTNCFVDGSCNLITYDSELNYTIDTDTSASTECTSDEVLLGNGSCISSASFGGGSLVQYVSFISTIDGDLKTTTKYLPLGTDSVASSDDEASWIIGRNMTITGVLWNAVSNARTTTSEVILMKSTSDKDSFFDTSLSVDIQGSTKGSQAGFGISFSQGDLAVIKYTSTTGGNKKIKDLSITLIGTYD